MKSFNVIVNYETWEIIPKLVQRQSAYGNVYRFSASSAKGNNVNLEMTLNAELYNDVIRAGLSEEEIFNILKFSAVRELEMI